MKKTFWKRMIWIWITTLVIPSGLFVWFELSKVGYTFLSLQPKVDYLGPLLVSLVLIMIENQLLLSSEIKASFENVENGVSKHLEAEKTLLKEFLKGSPTKDYFDNIIKVHNTAFQNQNSTSLNHSVSILKEATSSLENFFVPSHDKLSNDSKNSVLEGGIFKTNNIIGLYNSLAKHSRAICVFEKKLPKIPGDSYSFHYVEFLKTNNKIMKYFSFEDASEAAKDFFNEKKISVKKITLQNTGIIDGLDSISSYSHLAFQISSKDIISCSVLPIFSSVETLELGDQMKEEESIDVQFNKSSLVYLAFRMSKIPKSDNSDDHIVNFLSALFESAKWPK